MKPPVRSPKRLTIICRQRNDLECGCICRFASGVAATASKSASFARRRLQIMRNLRNPHRRNFPAKRANVSSGDCLKSINVSTMLPTYVRAKMDTVKTRFESIRLLVNSPASYATRRANFGRSKSMTEEIHQGDKKSRRFYAKHPTRL